LKFLESIQFLLVFFDSRIGLSSYSVELTELRFTKEISTNSSIREMKTKESHKNTPPKSKGHWLFRDLRELTKSPLNYAIKYQAKYGDLFEVDSLSHKVMFASHPDIAKHLLVDNNKAYLQKSLITKY